MSITGIIVLWTFAYAANSCTALFCFGDDHLAGRITGRQLLALVILSPITMPVFMAAMAWAGIRYIYRTCKPTVSAVLNFSFGSPMDAWNGMRAVVKSMLK